MPQVGEGKAVRPPPPIYPLTWEDYMLTAERLREVLDCFPDTGVFVWKIQPNGRIKPGSIAGNVIPPTKRCNTSYVRIGVDNVSYRAHRLAFLYMTGSFPTFHLDHKDTDGTNNRWSNIREATPSQNRMNTKNPSTNKTGLKGVTLYADGIRFVAAIKVSGKRYHLGIFKTPEDAHDAYCAASRRLHGDFGRIE